MSVRLFWQHLASRKSGIVIESRHSSTGDNRRDARVYEAGQDSAYLIPISVHCDSLLILLGIIAGGRKTWRRHKPKYGLRPGLELIGLVQLAQTRR